MTKKPRHKPLRFFVTGALLIGPAVQGCDVFGDEPTGNEMAPPAVEPGVVAPESENETVRPGITPPENVNEAPAVEAPDPGVAAPDPSEAPEPIADPSADPEPERGT